MRLMIKIPLGCIQLGCTTLPVTYSRTYSRHSDVLAIRALFHNPARHPSFPGISHQITRKAKGPLTGNE